MCLTVHARLDDDINIVLGGAFIQADDCDGNLSGDAFWEIIQLNRWASELQKCRH